MLRSVFFSILVLFTTFSFSQEKRKGKFILHEGFQYCQNNTLFDMYSAMGDCPMGEAIRDGVTQKGGVFFDAGFLYKEQIKTSRFGLIAGVNVNQKGFTEEGIYTIWGENVRNSYTTSRKLTYLGLSAGASFDVIKFKKISVSLAGVAGYEFRVHADMSQADKNQFRIMAFSARSFMDVAYTCNNGISLHLMPYFQTALTNYSRALPYAFPATGRVYRPYSIGVNVGIGF